MECNIECNDYIIDTITITNEEVRNERVRNDQVTNGELKNLKIVFNVIIHLYPNHNG